MSKSSNHHTAIGSVLRSWRQGAWRTKVEKYAAISFGGRVGSLHFLQVFPISSLLQFGNHRTLRYRRSIDCTVSTNLPFVDCDTNSA